MKWPRGRYNGRRIVGVSFKFVIDVTDWRWVPVIGHHCGMFHWLFWRSWTEAAYESEWRAERRVVVSLDYESDPETGDVRIVQTDGAETIQEKAKRIGVKRTDTNTPPGRFHEDAGI